MCIFYGIYIHLSYTEISVMNSVVDVKSVVKTNPVFKCASDVAIKYYTHSMFT